MVAAPETFRLDASSHADRSSHRLLPLRGRPRLCCWRSALSVAGLRRSLASPAHALSEIKREDVPGAIRNRRPNLLPTTPIEKETLPPVGTVPIPDSTTTTPPTAEQPCRAVGRGRGARRRGGSAGCDAAGGRSQRTRSPRSSTISTKLPEPVQAHARPDHRGLPRPATSRSCGRCSTPARTPPSCRSAASTAIRSPSCASSPATRKARKSWPSSRRC